jgi:hypothetical protein
MAELHMTLFSFRATNLLNASFKELPDAKKGSTNPSHIYSFLF